ncbi:MAG: efflux transporter outer membrane subunit [Betaproteobacteria bacterium]
MALVIVVKRIARLRPTTHVIVVAAAALLAALSGCMVGPDYVRPSAPVPTAFKEAPGWKVAQPADDAPRGNWWEAFGDPDLDALCIQVDISNQTVMAADARMREALAATQGARSALFPFVGGSGAAARAGHGTGSSASANTSSGVSNSFNLALFASWEVDLWGGIRRSVEASTSSAQASAADLAGARLSAQALLAQDYLLLRVQDAQIALLRNTVTTYERSLLLTRNQYAAGIVGRGDVVQAEAQLKSTQAQVVDATLSRAQLEHAIAVLVGSPPSEFAITPKVLVAVFPDIPVTLPSDLLERRPDIAAAERRTASANAQIGVAQAAFFPALTLSAGGGYQNSLISNLLSLPSRYWSLGAALAQPIFDAGLRSAQKAQAVATYDETVANYRSTVLSGFQDVEDNLSALELLAQEAVFQDGAVKAAQQAATIATNQYKAGITSYLAVVVLQANALNAERTGLAILARRLAASVGLIKALGGGWSADTVAQARYLIQAP